MSSGNQVSRNFAVLSAGQMASRLLAFATTIHIAQVLLPEKFGAVTLATGVLLYAGLLVDFGFDNYGPIEVSRGTTPLNKLAGTVLTFRSLLVVPAYVLLYLFVTCASLIPSFVPISPVGSLLIELYGVSLIANAFDLTWVFLGSKNMWPAVVAEIITQTIVAAGAYGLIHSPGDAVFMPAFFLVGRLIAVSFLFITFVKTFGAPKLGVDVPFLKNLLKNAIPLCGSQVMAMISSNFDLILVGVWLGTAAAGLYGAATRIVWVPTTIAIAYYTALRPLVARAYVNGFAEVEQTFKRSVRVTTALAFGIGTGGTMLAQPIMTQVFGPTYAAAAAPFVILLMAFCLMLVSRNYRLVLVSFNHQVVDFRIMTAAAVVNIGLNIALAKPYGVTGAACATLASETLILILDYITTRRLISHVPLGRYIWRPVICCVIMATILLAAAPLSNLWLKIVLGGIAYAALLIVFRIVSTDEIRSLYHTLVPSKTVLVAPEISSARNLSSAGIGNEQ